MEIVGALHDEITAQLRKETKQMLNLLFID